MFDFASRRAGRDRRRMATLDDVRFCACLELVGFEHHHALQGQPYRILVVQNENSEIAARAARLYFEDAILVMPSEVESSKAHRDLPAITVRAEWLQRGRFRLTIGPD